MDIHDKIDIIGKYFFLFFVVAFVVFIIWGFANTNWDAESSTPRTKTCGYCDRSFKEGTDGYRTIVRTNLCPSCYNSMKAAEKALGD